MAAQERRSIGGKARLALEAMVKASEWWCHQENVGGVLGLDPTSRVQLLKVRSLSFPTNSDPCSDPRVPVLWPLGGSLPISSSVAVAVAVAVATV